MLEVWLGNGELKLGEVLMGLVLVVTGAGAGPGPGAGAGAAGGPPLGPCLRGLNLYQIVRHQPKIYKGITYPVICTPSTPYCTRSRATKISMCGVVANNMEEQTTWQKIRGGCELLDINQHRILSPR